MMVVMVWSPTSTYFLIIALRSRNGIHGSSVGIVADYVVDNGSIPHRYS